MKPKVGDVLSFGDGVILKVIADQPDYTMPFECVGAGGKIDNYFFTQWNFVDPLKAAILELNGYFK